MVMGLSVGNGFSQCGGVTNIFEVLKEIGNSLSLAVGEDRLV